MSIEITDEQLKAEIMEFLLQKGRWGAHYFPVDTMVNWLGRKVKEEWKESRTDDKEFGEGGLPLCS